MTSNARMIEEYKSRGMYRAAGQLAALSDQSNAYGCHYGMRSTRNEAVEAYQQGWNEIETIFRMMKGARCG